MLDIDARNVPPMPCQLNFSSSKTKTDSESAIISGKMNEEPFIRKLNDGVEPFTQSMVSPTERVNQISDKRFSNYPCRHFSSLLAVISFGVDRSEPPYVLSAKPASVIAFSAPMLPYISGRQGRAKPEFASQIQSRDQEVGFMNSGTRSCIRFPSPVWSSSSISLSFR